MATQPLPHFADYRLSFLLEHLNEIQGAEFGDKVEVHPVSRAGISRKDITEYFRMLNCGGLQAKAEGAIESAFLDPNCLQP